MNVGYVGLGNMGGALARRLQLRQHLMVYDRDPSALQRAVEGGSTAALGLAELGASCSMVLLCLPTSDHVRSAIFGDGGLVESVRPGTLIIDQSTGDPHATRQMAAELLRRDIHLLDAPVSGGIAGAVAGTIAIMVGATEDDFEDARHVLTAISPNVFYAGGVGNGHVIKLVNNLLSTTQRILTYEAMTLAAKNGVNPRTAHEILMAGGGRNAYIENTLGPKVLEGQLAVGFTLALAHKDSRLACQLGADSGVPLLLANTARNLYQIAIGEMGAEAQVDTVALVMDRMAGTNVVPGGPTAAVRPQDGER